VVTSTSTRQFSVSRFAPRNAIGIRAVVAWIAVILIAACTLSPTLTAHGAIEAINEGNRGEIGATPLRTLGYVIREGGYLVLSIFGFVTLISRRNRWIFVLSSAFLITAILIKDVVTYGDLNWAIYGVRPLLIAASALAVNTLLQWDCQRQLRVVELVIKALIVILVPITAYQLVTLPPVWGATFLGPRAMGFWPNPIQYSMALASFGLYLTVSKSRHSGAWLVICAALAITTGGRSGLLAIALLMAVQGSLSLGFRKVSRNSVPFIALLGSVVAVVGAVGLFALFSQQEISGRTGTESANFGNPRAAYIVESIGQIASEGGLAALLLGNRLGDGTNALFASGASLVISDNFFLMVIRSYGILGLLIFVMITIAWLRRLSVDKVAVALTALSFMMAQSFLEQHPIGMLTLAAAAWASHSRRQLDFSGSARVRP
jgi:hypothetical protein